MILRRHQSDFSSIIRGIIQGSGIRTIYASVCPGGGKSLLPVLAGQLIEAGLADKLIWIAPRLSLIDQAEREFINPDFREYLGHRLKIRSNTNEPNPCRGLNGFATTYNAVGLDDGILMREFQGRRYILVADEFHHIQEGSLWHQKIEPLFRLAAYRVMMSGTLQRGDETKIAFLPYHWNGGGLAPDLQETEDTAIIRYTRAEALRELAIIPLTFHLSDGEAKWESDSGRLVDVASMDRMNEWDASKAIYTALNTEYAEHLLQAGLIHWSEHRRQNHRATCLIVCSDIKQAKRHTENLSSWRIGARFEICTSEETVKALSAIKAIKAGQLDILITVAMAYEGIDIPSTSHIICLTRIRSKPWIEQMIARANRIDRNAGPYETQHAHIFAPADPLFKRIIADIEAEQLPILLERGTNGRSGGEMRDVPLFGESSPRAPGNIIPLSSAMTGNREVILAGNEEEPMKTSSEEERALLEQIEKHIRTYSFANRYNPKKINADVRQAMGKPRREMTLKELECCLLHVRRIYPLSHVRGTGRRVPTKAIPFPCHWQE